MLRFESLPTRSIRTMRTVMRARRRSAAFRRRFVPGIDLMEPRRLLSTLTVINNNDSGSGSLRATIAAATSGDTIDFSSKLNGQTITLTSGELTIGVNLTIDGPGAGQLRHQRRQHQPGVRGRGRARRDHQRPEDHPRVRRGSGRRHPERWRKLDVVRRRPVPERDL